MPGIWLYNKRIQPISINKTETRPIGCKPNQTSYARFLQVAGLTYTWDNLSDTNPEGNNQVVEVRKDGVAIDKNAT
jgi:hypothetical protein